MSWLLCRLLCTFYITFLKGTYVYQKEREKLQQESAFFADETFYMRVTFHINSILVLVSSVHNIMKLLMYLVTFSFYDPINLEYLPKSKILEQDKCFHLVWANTRWKHLFWTLVNMLGYLGSQKIKLTYT